VLEIRKNGNANPWKQYVYHPEYVDAIALRYYDANTDGNVVEHYYLQDANFNVTAVTDNAGTVVERYSYTPYGEVTYLDASFSALALQGSAISNEHLYTGRRLDPETGLQLNRNRFYASHLGRWVNRDPIGYRGGDANLYAYVGAIPLRYVDPLGLNRDSFQFKRKCGKCPNEKEYDTRRQCCEDGKIVSKVPIWVCKTSLGSDGGFRLGDYAHSYIVCDDPKANHNTDEKYGYHPYPFDGDGGWDDEGGGGGFRPWGPGFVNRETERDPNDPGTSCKKRMVCPKEKRDKCKEGYWKPGSFNDRYNMCGWGPNCHEWANGY